MRGSNLNHLLRVRPYWVFVPIKEGLGGGKLVEGRAGPPVLLGHEVGGQRKGEFFGQCRHEGKGVGKRVGSDHHTDLRSWPD